MPIFASTRRAEPRKRPGFWRNTRPLTRLGLPSFPMFAVCGRFPHNLANQAGWSPVKSGVYNCIRGSDVIRATEITLSANE